MIMEDNIIVADFFIIHTSFLNKSIKLKEPSFEIIIRDGSFGLRMNDLFINFFFVSFKGIHD